VFTYNNLNNFAIFYPNEHKYLYDDMQISGLYEHEEGQPRPINTMIYMTKL
jgi:hypothetical protein